MIHRCHPNLCNQFLKHNLIASELAISVITELKGLYYDNEHDYISDVSHCITTLFSGSDNIITLLDTDTIICRGFLYAYIVRNVAYCEWLIVNPSCRNKGLGTHLMIEMEREAKSIGCDTLAFDINTDNAIAHSFAHRCCDRLGYRPIYLGKLWYGKEYAIFIKSL